MLMKLALVDIYHYPLPPYSCKRVWLFIAHAETQMVILPLLYLQKRVSLDPPPPPRKGW